jgi:hypothetical protein
MSRAAALPNATEATKPVSSPLELTTVNHETNIARPATAAAMWVRVDVISLAFGFRPSVLSIVAQIVSPVVASAKLLDHNPVALDFVQIKLNCRGCLG